MTDLTSTTSTATPTAERTRSMSATARDYLDRVRGGDVGSLPAVLGLVVLLAVFSALRPESFTDAFNIANLINQSAAVIVIAMGLVFVLLLGEIDLSAGFTGGTAAAVMGVVLTGHGQPWPLAVLAGVLTGAFIGLCIGLLVGRLGIPSFVVTLAAFLGLQGVLLQVIGEGGTIAVRDQTLLALNNDTLPVTLGWAFYLLVVLGYAAVAVRRATSRRADGLQADALSIVLAKAAALALLLGAVTAYLSQERSPNPLTNSIKGLPIVVVLLVGLLVSLNFLLGRTSFGRHVYAVGGNTEAARRAGINVLRVRITCFVLSSALAAIAGLLLASRDNSISPTTGGGETLLYAVGAAVIGGTSLFGGKGRMLDAVLGGLVIAVIINGMGLLDQPSSVLFMVTGVVLLVAASVDALSRKRAATTGRV